MGQRFDKGTVVLSLIEKKTENYIAILIPSRTSEAVMAVMNVLKGDFKDSFSRFFKTITVYNGPEFAEFAAVEQ